MLYQHTDKHPAQTALVDEDVPTGNIRVQEWSSLITPQQKSDIIGRCEDLLRAVKKARSRANEQQIDITPDMKVGRKMLDYIFG